MAGSVMQTADRKLGMMESNWCTAIKEGTGITISSIWFARRVPLADVESAVGDLLARHPRLRSEITQEQNELWFHTPAEVSVQVAEVDQSSRSFVEEVEEEENVREPWHLITEEELNAPFPEEYPLAVFVPKLYLLPHSESLLVLRMHAAAADMASTAIVVKDILNSLHSRSGSPVLGKGDDDGEAPVEELVVLPSVEDAIPAGQANKPFWAHGLDVVGYGLVSRRHAYLPFDDTESSRLSKLLRGGLSAEATTLLLKECKSRGVSIHGAIHAAALKAVTAYKQVGARGEHYGTAVLLQCRDLLDPKLSDSTIGFYHAAVLKTIHSTEPEAFWDLTKRCSDDFASAMKNRKHFTDMSDLNALMVQAMRFPNLTPSGTLRTSVLSTMFHPVVEDVSLEVATSLGVKDYVSCSSMHGVGPSLALNPFFRNSALHFSFLFVEPLYSRPVMQKLVDSILFFLSKDQCV